MSRWLRVSQLELTIEIENYRECLPSLYYGTDFCPVKKSQLQSFEFIIRSSFRTLKLRTSQQSLHYNEYRMPQRVSSLACRHATTSFRHCWSCIGCRYTKESSSSWVFWCTWHTIDSRRCTLATPWRQSVAYHLVGDYALLTQQTTWCQGHVLSSGKV